MEAEHLRSLGLRHHCGSTWYMPSVRFWICRRGSQLRRHCGIEGREGLSPLTEVSPQPAAAAPLRYLLDLGLKQGWAGISAA